MFIGHFGVGFGAKALSPRVSLGVLLLAAQFLDLLWPTLLLLGVETVRIAPGVTVVTPLLFEHYPVSHSLVAVAGWSLLAGAIALGLLRDRRTAIVIGLLVASHWLLDLVVHQPDLPILPAGPMAGFGAWNSLPLTLAIELPLFAAGVWLYLRATTARDRIGIWSLAALVAFLVVVYFANLFGDPPPSTAAIAWIGHAQWLLVLWGFWIDRHRTAREPASAGSAAHRAAA